MRWDIFCQVIDNYGDAGVCWRLARELSARGHSVRLWIDDPAPLHWLGGLPATGPAVTQPSSPPSPIQHQGLTILPWRPGHAQSIAPALLLQAQPDATPDVLIEAFGCDIPQPYLQALARQCRPAGASPWPVWLNLEYLSAEDYVQRMHRLPSPVMHGAAQGRSKTFFYPGFTAQTGGLLREQDLADRQARFDRAAWRRQWLPAVPPSPAQTLWISLFAYEPACLRDWLHQWAFPASTAAHPPPAVHLLAAAGRSQTYLRQCWAQLGWPEPHASAPWQQGQLHVHWLDFMSQPAYDELLWACDLNIVRGEDSLVRALWAGKPLLWHIYPQDDNAHHAKLDAFLHWLQAPPDWRRAMHTLNGMSQAPHVSPAPANLAALSPWQTCVSAARSSLLAQDDLATQLLHFVQRSRGT